MMSRPHQPFLAAWMRGCRSTNENKAASAVREIARPASSRRQSHALEYYRRLTYSSSAFPLMPLYGSPRTLETSKPGSANVTARVGTSRMLSEGGAASTPATSQTFEEDCAVVEECNALVNAHSDVPA